MKQFEYCNMWELDGEMGTIDAKNIIQAREKLAKMYPNTKIVHAANMMKKRAKNSRIYTLISKYISNYQKELIRNGTHNFQISNCERVKNGTHNFLKDINGNSMSKKINHKRIKNGAHHFQGKQGSKLATERSELPLS